MGYMTGNIEGGTYAERSWRSFVELRVFSQKCSELYLYYVRPPPPQKETAEFPPNFQHNMSLQK